MRVQGDFTELSVQHDKLPVFIGDTLPTAVSQKVIVNRQDAFAAKQLLREATHLTEIMAAAFPEEVDVSFYGYNEADTRFAA